MIKVNVSPIDITYNYVDYHIVTLLNTYNEVLEEYNRLKEHYDKLQVDETVFILNYPIEKIGEYVISLNDKYGKRDLFTIVRR